jgi:tripartite-type tricarboxylate transporter receptor subunit TctC
MMWPARRRALLAAALLPMAGAAAARATQTIEWLIGYPAGGGSDLVARLLCGPMSRLLGQTIVVSNKPGGATTVAAQQLVHSKKPMLFCADFATLAANPSLFSKLPYDAEQDFAWVGMLARSPMVVVAAPQLPVHNLGELTAWLKRTSNPSFASAGIGSPHHLIGVQVSQMLGLQLNHVGFRGASPAVVAVVGGQVPMALMDIGSAWTYVRSGRLKALAVTALTRTTQLPQVPTLDELGYPAYQAYAWQSVVAPKNSPEAWLLRLNAVLQASLALPEVQQGMQEMGVEPLPSSPQQAALYVRRERLRWAEVIAQHQIHID